MPFIPMIKKACNGASEQTVIEIMEKTKRLCQYVIDGETANPLHELV